jgi:HTH-type transcriptional regulator, sugar sensing transcriptional regulator
MDVFDALDLTEGERKVYSSLVRLGSTTTGPLYKEAKVSQSKVYEILERLKKKGLAASIIRSGVRYWHPANPSIYLENLSKEFTSLKEKKKILENELPRLLKEETYPKDEAEVFIGYNGFRTALFSFLDTLGKNDEFVIFGSPKEIPEPFYSFLVAFNKERVKTGISARFLYGSALRSFAEKLYDISKTKVRYLEGITPASLGVGKDRVILFNFDGEGRTIVINGRELSEGFRGFFDSLWKIAKA